MSTTDWISLGEWLAGVLFGMICLLCGLIWWVRREGLSAREELAVDIRNSETRFILERGKQDMQIEALKQDLKNFQLDITGKLFTRADADMLRRDMVAMIDPVKVKQDLLQSTVDRESGVTHGKLDMLCALLEKQGKN